MRLPHRILALLLAPLLVGACRAVPGPARLGMRVERTESRATEVLVLTTGARYRFRPDGSVLADGRLPEERPLATLRVTGPPHERWQVVSADADAVTLRAGALEAEVHGDSLLVLRAGAPATLGVDPAFRPAYTEQKEGRWLLLDETGGIGLYPSAPRSDSSPTPPIAEPFGPGNEIWCGVFPPRPPSAERLLQSIAHEGRPFPLPEAPYPSTGIIEESARHCQVFALHAYFWKDAPEELKPKAGKYAGRQCPWLTTYHEPSDPVRFARVQSDVRRAGMKFVVYVSPYYSNAPDIFAELERIRREYHVDGFYFDGVSKDFRKSYAIVRRAREILGDDGILYIHCSTDPLGSPRIYCPFIDTYADFILRGESARGDLPLEEFLRYTVSGWNISNAVGVWCYYGSTGRPGYVNLVPLPEHIDAALRNHVRLWRQSCWHEGEGDIDAFDRAYYPALAALQKEEIASLPNAR